jgi:hypothetical protein
MRRGDDVDKHLMRPQLTTHDGATMLLDGITSESSLRHEQQKPSTLLFEKKC